VSNRTTRNAFAAKPLHNASGLSVSCAAKPMIGGFAGSSVRPKLSYSMSMPLALTWGVSASLEFHEVL
jgi:hypothetical protein